MRGFQAVFKRELFALFVTPVAWFTMTGFLLIQGLHFYLVASHFAAQPELSADSGPVQAFFGGTILLYPPLLIICPVLTMRLFAEERRSGTIEPLMTAPVSAAGVVLGKYCAALFTYALMWAPTLRYVLLASEHGSVDWRVVAAGYLAVLAVGAGYLAIGTMTSALSRSQVSAAVLSAMACIGLFVLGIGEFILPDGPAHDLCAYVSVWGQMNDFSRGIIDSRRLLYDLTLVALPLYVTVKAVDSWRYE
ncbi:MAG: ABC transporter permease [Myxococcales bacterium]|nr:ABC transporter permease [Myxococcales bacterium]